MAGVQTSMPTDENEPTLVERFRRFKRHALRLRVAVAKLGADGDLQFHMHWREGEPLAAKFDEREKLFRFAALLRPFMSADSPLSLSHFGNLLLKRISFLRKQRRRCRGILQR